MILTPPKNWHQRWTLVAGITTTTVGLVVLFGWAIKNIALIQISPTYAPMQRNTAFGFMLCGSAFLLSGNQPWRRMCRRFCGLTAALFGLLTLAEYGLSLNLGLDLLLGDAWTMVRAPYPGRMSPLTAFCFLLTGTAILAATGRSVSRPRGWVIALAGTLTSAISLASLFSYPLGASAILGWAAVTWMAVHTATCFLALGSSLIAQAWFANTQARASLPISARSTPAPAWAPLCTGIGAGSVLLALVQSALSLDGPKYSAHHLVGFLAAFILTLLFMVMVPMDIKHRIGAGLSMALAVFLLTAYFSLRSLALDEEGQAWVAHTQQVLVIADQATSHLRQAASAYRDFISTSQPSELQHWGQNIELATRDFSRLRTIAADNPRQQQALERVDQALEQTISATNQRVQIQLQLGAAASLKDSQGSSNQPDISAVETLVVAIQAEERRLMQLRMDALADSLGRTRMVIALGDILAILFLVAAGAIAAIEFGERKQTERALTAARQKLTMALAAGNMGTWELDLISNQSWRSIEHDRIFGCDSALASWGSDSFLNHVYPDDLDQVQDAFAKARLEGRLSFESRIIRADSTLRWIAVEGSVVYDNQHSPLAMTGVLHDVTASKELQNEIIRLNEDLEARVTLRTAELTEANSNLEAFTYSAAHDLRAPLRHMNGFVSLIHQNCYEKLDADGRRYLDKIASSSRHMGMLLDDLLNFARLGKVGLQRNQVSLGQMVARIQEALEPDLSGRDLTWEIGPLSDVSADLSLLNQVMTNLISNAVKFTRKCDKAHIKIGSYPLPDQSLTVFVTDNGAGFDMKYADKLFGVFQRLHNAQDFEGTGIGLAIVRRVVERHGGRVWAEGAPGIGATFSFSLPNKGAFDATTRLHPDGRR